MAKTATKTKRAPAKKATKTVARKVPAKKAAPKKETKPKIPDHIFNGVPKLLPPGTEKNDFVYPWDLKFYGIDPKAEQAYLTEEVAAQGIGLYYTERFGWVVATLGISKGKRGAADRTYGVTLDDGQIVRVGNGPHVLHNCRLYVRKSREKALAQYVERFREGLKGAHEVRDRISSRRAQGAARRMGFGGFSWLG